MVITDHRCGQGGGREGGDSHFTVSVQQAEGGREEASKEAGGEEASA